MQLSGDILQISAPADFGIAQRVCFVLIFSLEDLVVALKVLHPESSGQAP